MDTINLDYKNTYPAGPLMRVLVKLFGTEIYQWFDGAKSYWFRGKIYIITLAALMVLPSVALAQYTIPFTASEHGDYWFRVTVNGHAQQCLFDTGASAADDAFWMSKAAAKRAGMARHVNGAHTPYYSANVVTAGNFTRQSVRVLEYANGSSNADNWDACLLGLSFFKSLTNFEIDTVNRQLRAR